MHKCGCWLAAVVTGMVCLSSASAVADDIKIDNLWYRNVRIRGLRDGKLMYITSGTTRDVDLARIADMSLSRYPQYAQAVEAMGKGDPKTAITRLNDAMNGLREDYLEPLFQVQLVRAYDADGQFTQAVTAWLELVRQNREDYFIEAAPTNVPTDAQQRRQAEAQLGSALATTRNASLRRTIEQLVAKLKADPGAATATEDAGASGTGTEPNVAIEPAPEPTPTVTNHEASTTALKLIFTRLEQGNYDEVLKRVASLSDQPNAPVAELLYARGMALAGKGEAMSGALELLRVAVLFGAHDLAGPSLLEAGKLLKGAGHAEAAKKVLTEATAKARSTPVRRQAQQLLNQL